MNHDSVAVVCVGGSPERLSTDANHQLLISTSDADFKERFRSWQLEQHLSKRKVRVIVKCFPVKYRVEIETRFNIKFPKTGKEEEVGADVVARRVGSGNFSNICIGVCHGKYELE